MIIFLISTAVGFACLIFWDAAWVFWTIGALLILGGFGMGSDDRKRDGRFKTGYKNNAEDQSDISLAFKLIGIGVLVCILAYYSRDSVAWIRGQHLLFKTWLDRNFWLVALSISFVIVAVAFMMLKSFWGRIKHSSEIHRLREELDREATDELKDLQN